MRKVPEMPGHKGRAEMDEKMDEQLTVKYIRTKSKVRKIVTYKEQDGELRRYHEEVAKFLNKNVKQSVFAKAYTPRSSIYKNARAHMYNDIFLKMDIKNFFPNINHKYLELYYSNFFFSHFQYKNQLFLYMLISCLIYYIIQIIKNY